MPKAPNQKATWPLRITFRFRKKNKSQADIRFSLSYFHRYRKRVVIDPNLRDPLAFAIELLTNSTNEFVSLSDGVSDHDANDACQDFLRSQRKFEEPDAKVNIIIKKKIFGLR